MPTVRRISNPSGGQEGGSVPPRRRRPMPQGSRPGPLRPVQRPRPRPEPEDDNKPTPLLLKILSWLGIILLCFVLGYLGTSWIVDFLNNKLLLKPENRIENQEDFQEFKESEQQKATQESLKNSDGNLKQVLLVLYHVQNNSIAVTRQNFVLRAVEDNISDAVNSVIALSELPGSDNIKLLHVFRDDDTAFLDMPGQFASALELSGQRESLLLLTSIVRTLQENFSPLSQVKFLIDSKPAKGGGVVDLSVPWKMPKKS